MSNVRLLIIAAMAVFALACGKKEEAKEKAPALPGDPVAGEAVYARVCLACHGKDGRANGGTTAADFVGDPTRLQKPIPELINSITNGFKGKVSVMPAHKDKLSEQEIKDALSYVIKTYGK